MRWLPIRQQLFYRNAVIAFKCVTGLAPDSLIDHFMKRSDVSTRTTRNSQKLQIPLLMHLSMLSPREGGGGGRANHGSLIVKYAPRVGVLIVCDVPRLAILIVQRTFSHFHFSLGGHFDQLFCPLGREFEFFKMKMSKSPPHARPPLPEA